MENSNNNTHYVMVPGEALEEILQGIRQLLNKPQGFKTGSVEGYVSEKEAQELLGRKTTWFWTMRTKGLLGYTKIGNKIFYKLADLEALLDNHRKEAFTKRREY